MQILFPIIIATPTTSSWFSNSKLKFYFECSQYFLATRYEHQPLRVSHRYQKFHFQNFHSRIVFQSQNTHQLPNNLCRSHQCSEKSVVLYRRNGHCPSLQHKQTLAKKGKLQNQFLGYSTKVGDRYRNRQNRS